MVGRAVALSDELELTGRHVFFNADWVPYAERGGWLLEADAAVSTHRVHEETRYAFRTRILDYLWAGLPMVVTEGDGFADLVTARDLGIVVPEGDVTALADALEIVLEDDDVATRFRRAVPAVAAEFAWPRALAPILAFVEDPVHARDYQPGRVGMSELGSVRRTAGVGHDLRMAWHHLTHAGPSGVLRRLRDRGRAS
jgi:glycosyltransferase involved in cell wall biosynthesis